MAIHPIRNEDDHAKAMARIAALWNAEPGSDAFYELDALATLVDAYEAKLYPIPAVDPVSVLRYAVTEMGHSQAALAKILGSRSRASEVLNGKRALTVDMIRAISAAWRIPVDLLVGPAPADPALKRAG